MSDEIGFSRRLFLRNALLAGLASVVAVEDAEAKTKRRRHRRVHVSHPHKHKPLHSHVANANPEGAPRGTLLQPDAPASPLVRPLVSGSGGGGGGGGGGAGWSDRRLKRAVRRIGTSPSGLPIYSFQYVWGGPRFEGVMAQDLVRLRPDAIIRDASGYLKVDYARIDVQMRTAAPRRAA